MQERSNRLAQSSPRMALSLATAALVAACGGAGAPASTRNDSSGSGTVTPQSADSSTQPAANPCDGLVPTFGAPISIALGGADCDYATSSPWGQVAIGRCCMESGVAFDLYSASGENQGRITGLPAWSQLAWQPDPGLWFSWTSDGYVGLAGRPGSGRVTFWDDHGVPVAVGPMAVALAPDGAGGTVALTRDGATTELSWFDPGGHPIRSAAADGSPRQLIVNWATHHVLTIEDRATGARARWYDGSGAPIGDWIELGSIHGPRLHLLVDGSIAIGESAGIAGSTGGRWQLVLRDGAPSADPAPAWLAELPTTWLATIRNAGGYAASSDGMLQILTPDGVKCATLPVPDAGDPSHPAWIAVGQDGTLIETLRDAAANRGCLVHWWPALLR